MSKTKFFCLAALYLYGIFTAMGLLLVGMPYIVNDGGWLGVVLAPAYLILMMGLIASLIYGFFHSAKKTFPQAF